MVTSDLFLKTHVKVLFHVLARRWVNHRHLRILASIYRRRHLIGTVSYDARD